MALWDDIAEWVGPTPNKVIGGMVEYRGLVIHIMQGTYIGSIAWGKNPASSVSFHFATQADGHIGQLVDTDDAAWTQANGNGHWLSVENEGYSGNELTAGQVEACAKLYARGVREYGWPCQLTDSTTGHGLGWHGMGGTAWGGHPDCPGAPIVAQRQQILDLARQINEGAPQRKDDQMFMLRDGAGSVAMVDGIDPATRKARAYWIGNAEFNEYQRCGVELRQVDAVDWSRFTLNPIPGAGGTGGGAGVTKAEVAEAVRVELNKTHLAG